MRFQQRGTVPLDAVANVRMTPAEKASLKAEAEAAGLSLSELVRRRALGRTVTAKIDTQMIAELRRQGGLMKKIFADTDGAHAALTGEALAEIQAYIKLLREQQERVNDR
jgi:hypothetical protein